MMQERKIRSCYHRQRVTGPILLLQCQWVTILAIDRVAQKHIICLGQILVVSEVTATSVAVIRVSPRLCRKHLSVDEFKFYCRCKAAKTAGVMSVIYSMS
jgi:hypothetical protein